MTDEPVYLLDANVFIEASRRYYAFDLVPRFWTVLAELGRAKRLCSIDRIDVELQKGRDQLAEWAARDFADSFVSTDEDDIVNRYREVMTWAASQAQFTDAAKDEFARVADGWLVAYGKAKNCIVVTQEQFSPDVRRRVLIPNACNGVGVEYLDTFEMLRRLGVRLA